MPEAHEQAGGGGPERARLSHLVLVVLAGVLLYLPGLGRQGFAATEGHRVIPGWEMLESGDFWLPRMFGQVYLRKPPGMPWAVALSSAVLGQTEFAARLVSASFTIGLGLITAIFAARWFGHRYGLAGGLAALLTPLFWGPGRTAEIEALNNFGAAVCVFLILDLLLVRRARSAAMDGSRALWTVACAAVLAAGVIIAALAKGPAAAPAICAALVVPCLMAGSVRPLLAPAVWLAALGSAAVLALLYQRISHAVEASGQVPVVQGVSDFLWTGRPFSGGDLLKVILMPAAALFAIAPWSIGMLFPWGRDAAAETGDTARGRAHRLARAVTLTALASIVFLAVIGVRNERYAQPSLAVVPVLGAYMLRGYLEQFLPHRRRIAGAFLLGSVWAWPALLVVIALAVMHFPRHEPNYSGKAPGAAIAPHLPDGGTILADHLIEARPEVLLYARRAAAADARRIHIRWLPGLASNTTSLSRDELLALRTDDASDELSGLEGRGLGPFERLATGSVHKFSFTLVRPAPQTAQRDPAGNSP